MGSKSNAASLLRHLLKRPYAPKADQNFDTMRRAEQKRRRRRIRNLDLVASGALRPAASPQRPSGRIVLPGA